MLLCFGADPNISDKKVIKFINILYIFYFLSCFWLCEEQHSYLTHRNFLNIFSMGYPQKKLPKIVKEVMRR